MSAKQNSFSKQETKMLRKLKIPKFQEYNTYSIFLQDLNVKYFQVLNPATRDSNGKRIERKTVLTMKGTPLGDITLTNVHQTIAFTICDEHGINVSTTFASIVGEISKRIKLIQVEVSAELKQLNDLYVKQSNLNEVNDNLEKELELALLNQRKDEGIIDELNTSLRGKGVDVKTLQARIEELEKDSLGSRSIDTNLIRLVAAVGFGFLLSYAISHQFWLLS